MENHVRKTATIALATVMLAGTAFAGDNQNATFTITSATTLPGVGAGELVEISIDTDNWVNVQQADVTLEVSSPDHFDVSIAALVLGEDLADANAFPPGNWHALGGLLVEGTDDQIRVGFALLDPDPDAEGHTGTADFRIRLLTSNTLTTDTEASVVVTHVSLGPGAFERDIISVNETIFINPATATAVSELPGAVPNAFELEQNYPNPFNPSTNIRFNVPHEAPVLVRVYDALGKVQETLVDEVLPAGRYTVDFQAADLASGMYFYRIEAPGFTSTRKSLLLK
jgi:hypothetical protein